MRATRRLAFAAPFVLIAACSHHGGQAKEPAGRNFATWSVTKSGDSCQAYDTEESCPKDATCNPPPPMVVDCPDGMLDGTSMTVVQPMQGGECWTQPADGTAPMQLSCPHAD